MQGMGTNAGENPWMGTSFWKLLWSEMQNLLGRVRIGKKTRALQLEETLPLGERRFLAVVRWQNDTLLVGVTAQSITLLEPHVTKPRFVRSEEPDA